ncbi:glycine cleavage system aminomethyltransferase GcvT [Gordonia westfalica]|uniref:Aminomethyltransferase n=1 Tax=Gordonia westfalica TaxID=158898 RepID=A0ABU2GZ29_9ACTN|nr:glycine cleavage system aminomethyltransferase GcvT [Gordonia westfalica]MDS1116722.1 glycine cleavage system aminomethyltransferase GcvT [Gordonia westfalica]
MKTTTPVGPLEAEHEQLGATFTDFAGWRMPLKYTSELQEHHTVRTSAGQFDLSHMGEIAVTGPQSPELLDYALAGQLSSVQVGRAKYSLLCNPDGGVIDDLVVYRLAHDRFLIVANAANTTTVFDALTERAGGFDASVVDQSGETALVAVQGPKSAGIVRSLLPPDEATLVDALKYYASMTSTLAGIEVLLARTGYTGEDGFELYVNRTQAVQLWRALLDETRSQGGTAAGLASRDTLRLEAGMALYGHELSLTTTPYEAGLGRVVRLDKEFVGRGALAEQSQTAPQRTLLGLVGSGRRAARAGYAVCDLNGDREVGVVTSGALSPTLGYPIALAYISGEEVGPGTELTVDIRGRKEKFVVVPTPFYRRTT